jgi:hypothetical protein
MNMDLRSKIARQLGLPEKLIIPEFYPFLIAMLKFEDRVSLKLTEMKDALNKAEKETKILQGKIEGKITINDHSKLKPFHSFVVAWGWLFTLPFILMSVFSILISVYFFQNNAFIKTKDLFLQNENGFYLEKKNYIYIYNKKGKIEGIKLKNDPK